jgi:hypothetical protein
MLRKGSSPSRANAPKGGFQQQAEQVAPGIVVEFFDFVLHNKKWWVIPIVVCLLVLGLLACLVGNAGGIAPFIYTLF